MLELQGIRFAGWALTKGQHRPKAGKKKKTREVKWCLKEKVLLGKWSAIAMLELQRIWFAGWALTEGQHRPKAGKHGPKAGKNEKVELLCKLAMPRLS